MNTTIMTATMYDGRRGVVMTVYRLYVNGQLYAAYRTRAEAQQASRHVI